MLVANDPVWKAHPVDMFWQRVVEPVISAVKPRTVVEVGAETGAQTILILRWISTRRGTLHAIDPKPLFNAGELEHAYPKAFVMHQAMSLEALPLISDPDVVLLDGDHNWHTVISELRHLERARKWPVTFLHDIDWPYGRRDMYYDPANVPPESRQPFEYSGMVQKVSKLTPAGKNAQCANALHEGGPRNGVLTAVEDFMDESRHELELFLMPGPYGLALLIDRDRLKTKVGRVVQRVHDQGFALELSPRYASRYFD
jgi:methyltransferase family protein